MPSQIAPQWRNENEYGKYPFSSTATLTNGDVFIPDNVFIDVRLNPVGGGARQYISKMVKYGSSIDITISDADQELAYGSFSTANPLLEQVELNDQYARCAGMLLFSPTSIIPLSSWADDEYLFTVDQTDFCARTTVPMPPIGANGIVTPDGDFAGGEVVLVGGRGVTLTVENGETDTPTVYVHAVGDPLFKRGLCEESGNTLVSRCYLKTINGVSPDKYGNFTIEPCRFLSDEPILKIKTEKGRLIISVVAGRISSDG